MVYHIPYAWASALSVSTVGQCEKPRVVGWATGKIPTLFVSMGLINNLKPSDSWEFCRRKNMKESRLSITLYSSKEFVEV